MADAEGNASPVANQDAGANAQNNKLS